MLLLELIYTLGGLGMSAISIPMIQRWVRPNPFYGFRTRKSLSSPAIWYEINAYSGKRLFIAGIFIALVGSLLPSVPQITVDLYATLVALVVVLTLASALIQSFLYLNQISK